MSFPQNVLFMLNVGAFIQVQEIGGGGSVVAVNPPGVSQTMLVMESGAGGADWLVAEYETDGETAKMALQQVEGTGQWVPGDSEGGYVNPLVLGDSGYTFLFTPTDDEYGVTIQTSTSPPPPYVWFEVQEGSPCLNYGHEEPLLQGSFQIMITG
jgi:hypothetical protein